MRAIKDANLYFTFPEGNEDCLAMGTIANGVFGGYRYRYPTYKMYCNNVTETFPGLQGGLRRTTVENRMRPLKIRRLIREAANEAWSNTPVGHSRHMQDMGRMLSIGVYKNSQKNEVGS